MLKRLTVFLHHSVFPYTLSAVMVSFLMQPVTLQFTELQLVLHQLQIKLKAFNLPFLPYHSLCFVVVVCLNSYCSRKQPQIFAFSEHTPCFPRALFLCLCSSWWPTPLQFSKLFFSFSSKHSSMFRKYLLSQLIIQ